MLRRFLRDSAIYSISAALSRGVAIILLPIYTRFLSPAEYGALDLLTILATLSSYIITLEISQGLARVYSEAGTENEKEAFVSSAGWFIFATYSICALTVICFAPNISFWLVNNMQLLYAIKTLACAVMFNGIFFFLQDLLRWQLKPKRYAIASIIYAVISAAAGALAVTYLGMGVTGIFAGQIIAAFTGIFISISNGAATDWKRVFDHQRWLEMLRYSGPQVISSCAAFCALYVDRFFIKSALGLDAVGVYGVGARIASLVALLMAGFQSGYIPIVFHNHAAPETRPEMARVFRIFLIAALSIALFLSSFSKELLQLFTTQQYFEYWYTIPILATSVMLANMYIFAPGVFIAKKTMFVAAINISSAILNVIMLLLLLPYLGVMGAAFASLISSSFAFMIYVKLNNAYYHIPFNWHRILIASLTALAFSVIFVLLQTMSTPGIMFLKCVLLLSSISTITYILLDRSELKQVLVKLSFR